MKKFLLIASCLVVVCFPVLCQEYYMLSINLNGSAVIVTPPGQLVPNSSFFLFAPGTRVSMRATYRSEHGVYCPAIPVSHQWSGNWSGDPAAETITLTMSSNQRITATFELLPPPCPPPGTLLKVVPHYTTVRAGKKFTKTIRIEMMRDIATGYDLTISYDPAVIELDNTIGDNGIMGAMQVTIPAPGQVNAFAENREIGPDAFTVHWVSIADGESPVQVSGTVSTVNGLPSPGQGNLNGLVKVSPLPGAGDVNGDNEINIIDALLVARYSVGLAAAPFNGFQADTNHDRSVTIIDALRIAQFYVGLIELQGVY